MSGTTSRSILLIGESGVGKTHYGAQLLRRLMVADGQMKMLGGATNLEPFEAALESLNEGKAASHTPTHVYSESTWPIGNNSGLDLELVWPDYGGEQIRSMIASKRVATAWQARIAKSSAWMLLIRPGQLGRSDDMLSRPPETSAPAGASALSTDHLLSDQARIIELLQMLLYIRGANLERPLLSPRLVLLLTCWDELNSPSTPDAVLAKHLPMLHCFVKSNWRSPICLGLSALGRPLAAKVSDIEYATKGPEQFGYVVLEDGQSTPDLTVPIYQSLGVES